MAISIHTSQFKGPLDINRTEELHVKPRRWYSAMGLRLLQQVALACTITVHAPSELREYRAYADIPAAHGSQVWRR